MDTEIAASISLERAVAFLRSRQQVGLDRSIQGLQRLRITAHAVSILHKFAPDKLEAQCTDIISLASMLRGKALVLPVEEVACRELLNLFPIDPDNMIENLLNYEGDDLNIMIYPQGSYRGYDDWDYAFSNIDDFDDGESLIVLAEMLDKGIDAEFWPEVCEHFHWPLVVPDCIAQNGPYYHVDGDLFVALLQEHNLAEVEAAFQIVWKNTENAFLDWTLEDAYTEAPLFNVANVEKLAAEWQDAQPVLTRYEQAVQMLEDDPNIVERIVSLWDACVIREKSRRPQTLVEVFAEDDEQLEREIIERLEALEDDPADMEYDDENED